MMRRKTEGGMGAPFKVTVVGVSRRPRAVQDTVCGSRQRALTHDRVWDIPCLGNLLMSTMEASPFKLARAEKGKMCRVHL